MKGGTSGADFKFDLKVEQEEIRAEFHCSKKALGALVDRFAAPEARR